MVRHHAMPCIICVGLLARQGWCDANQPTPYITSAPAATVRPPETGLPVFRTLSKPSDTRRVRASGSLPRVVSSAEDSGGESIRVFNEEATFIIRISADKRATLVSLQSRQTGVEFLAAPSPVFHIDSEGRVSSDAYRVVQWRGIQSPDEAELIVDFRSEHPTQKPAAVRWRTRLHRLNSRVEQTFESEPGGLSISQVLATKPGFRPVMPVNLFARGFVNGRPNLSDRRRFEYVEASEHLCYDEDSRAGLWGFVGEIGGEERFTSGAVAMIQHASFRTRRSGRFGPFVLQPFAGPAEVGFGQLREFVQRDYSIQKNSPSPFEWNQFWLWQGGPTRVDKSVVAEKRLMDVLPRIVAMGLEEFHLDDGWQQADHDWQIDRTRFPGGWQAIRDYTRRNGLGFHLWVNDASTDSPEFTLNLIRETGMNRLFMDRRVSEDTIAGLERVRAVYPAFSVNAHNSTSRSAYWSWGNIHFLSDINQVYFGEGQFWAWSSILPEQRIESKPDPLFPQLTEAQRFFSKHDLNAGDLITRSAAYQAHWVWPFNCVMPPHNGWSWFEHRPIGQLRNRLLTYLACKFKYEWGFDPRRLTPEAIDLHLDCTAWFKANRDYLTAYQHVLDPPDGVNVDAAGHLVDQSGYVFLFNPGDREQQVDYKDILWEPELQLSGPTITISDWTAMTGYTPLPAQDLANPGGHVIMGPGQVRVLGINLPCEDVLDRVRAARGGLSATPPADQ